MKNVRCYWKQNGSLCRTDVDNHVEEGAFETYGEVVGFVKANLSVVVPEGGDVQKFAVMAVVDR